MTSWSKRSTDAYGDWVQVLNVDYHRNGVHGEGFHVVLFAWGTVKGRSGGRFAAFVFDKPGAIAVSKADQLADGDIGPDNRWRGDVPETAIRAAIAEWSEAQKSPATEATGQV